MEHDDNEYQLESVKNQSKVKYKQIPVCDPASIGRGLYTEEIQRTEETLRGFNTHRLQREDRYHETEVKLSDEFAELCRSSPNMLEQMVFGNETAGVVLDTHEARLIATVIQWLGTPVGKSFMRRCGFEHEETLEHEAMVQRREIYDAICSNSGIVGDSAELKRILKIND